MLSSSSFHPHRMSKKVENSLPQRLVLRPPTEFYKKEKKGILTHVVSLPLFHRVTFANVCGIPFYIFNCENECDSYNFLFAFSHPHTYLICFHPHSPHHYAFSRPSVSEWTNHCSWYYSMNPVRSGAFDTQFLPVKSLGNMWNFN